MTRPLRRQIARHRPSSRVGHLGRRAVGLRRRRLPPHLARGRGHRRGRALRHHRLAARDLHGGPARRVCRRCRSRGRPPGPLRVAAPAARRARLISVGQLLVRVSPAASGWARRAGAPRHGRRDDLHEHAAPRRAVVPGQAGPVITQLSGMVGQLGAVAAATPLAAALRELRAGAVVRDLRRRRRPALGRPVPRRQGLALHGHGSREDQGARPRPHARRGVGQPGHPPRHVDPLHRPVRRDRLHDAVGLPVPRAGAGAQPDDGGHPAHHAHPGVDGRRSGGRPSHRRACPIGARRSC